MKDFDGDLDDSDDEDFAGLDEDDLTDDVEEGAATIACPYCRQEIYDDAVRCPYCERYIAEEDLREKKSWLIVIGSVVCLYIVYRWIAGSRAPQLR